WDEAPSSPEPRRLTPLLSGMARLTLSGYLHACYLSLKADSSRLAERLFVHSDIYTASLTARPAILRLAPLSFRGPSSADLARPTSGPFSLRPRQCRQSETPQKVNVRSACENRAVRRSGTLRLCPFVGAEPVWVHVDLHPWAGAEHVLPMAVW